MTTTQPLPVRHVAAVDSQPEVAWLVDGLWPEQGVGFLGGHPKSCKSWLALELALAVATGTSVLSRYRVAQRGSVLLFAAEDAPPMVRARLTGLANRRRVSLETAPIQLVLANSLRLESTTDQARLRATVAQQRPKLLILDPFVRMTRIDENSAHEVSNVLGYLRELQRDHRLAILVVHHIRKSAGNGGQALRGSGDFWAWSDTNLYLTRKQESLHLAIEHRSAPTPEPVMLQLCDQGPGGPHLRLNGAAPAPPEPTTLADRVLEYLRNHGGARKLEEVRAAVRVRMQSVVDTLRDLESIGEVRRTAGGWRLGDRTESGETEAGSAETQPAKG